MSYENGTTHYNLPQTVGTDKRDWTDTNQAFADIDSAIHTAIETAETGATNIQALQTDVNALDTRVTSAEGDIATNTTDIGLLNTKVNSIDADIADVRQDAEDMICAYNEATATSAHAYAVDDYFIYNDVLYKVTAPIAIGGTIVPNTNCKATNITTEIISGSIDTTASNVSYDDILTQLGVDDVQGAIVALKTLIDNIGGGNMPIINFTNPLYVFPADNTSHSYTVPSGKRAVFMGSATGTNAAITINGLSITTYFDNEHVGYGNGYIPLNEGDVISVTTFTLGAVVLEVQ